MFPFELWCKHSRGGAALLSSSHSPAIFVELHNTVVCVRAKLNVANVVTGPTLTASPWRPLRLGQLTRPAILCV